jgi:2-polyprenyl-3-methyl-5-hydroxy-6-metoxy-1,4-benzoquinol methylase
MHREIMDRPNQALGRPFAPERNFIDDPRLLRSSETMATPTVTPESIVQVCSGLWAAGVLKGAVELQVFDQLAPGPQDVDGLSETLSAPPQSLKILLDALVALGFLDRVSQGYCLTPVSAEFLVTTKPTYLGGFAAEILMHPALFDLYNNFRRVVTEGYRRDLWEYRTGSHERIVPLVRQLFTLGYPIAQAIADHVGWTQDHPAALRLLDVGCGSAVYSLVALTRLPQARLTAQDWPRIVPVAEEFATQLRVADRVQTLAGDMQTIEFGGPYDAVFLGHILHNYADADCRALLRKCLGVLAPGGKVIVVEFLAEAGDPASTFAWLFSTMMHATHGMRSFSSAEIRQMLTDGGASRTEVGGGLPTGFVIGYRD